MRVARSMVLMVLAKVLQRWDLQMGFGAVWRARAGKLVTPSPQGHRLGKWLKGKGLWF